MADTLLAAMAWRYCGAPGVETRGVEVLAIVVRGEPTSSLSSSDSSIGSAKVTTRWRVLVAADGLGVGTSECRAAASRLAMLPEPAPRRLVLSVPAPFPEGYRCVLGLARTRH